MSLFFEIIPLNSTCTTFQQKSMEQRRLINEALTILQLLGIPLKGLSVRALERMGMALLAVIDINKSTDWQNAKDFTNGVAMKSRDIINYWNTNFNESVSSGSYDDVRRKDLSLLVQAGIIINTKPDSARNNPSRGYALNPEYTQIIKSCNSPHLKKMLEEFMHNRPQLSELMMQRRDVNRVNITIPSGETIEFSPGEHNALQKAIVEQFLPIFGFGAELLYLGDTSDKNLIYNEQRLIELGFFELAHGELPDVVAYSQEKNWLFVIEAVYSCNPITVQRKMKIDALTSTVCTNIVYVSAFLDKKTFAKFAPAIAWETEVWIADNPEHMIHFNGSKFLGPHI